MTSPFVSFANALTLSRNHHHHHHQTLAQLPSGSKITLRLYNETSSGVFSSSQRFITNVAYMIQPAATVPWTVPLSLVPGQSYFIEAEFAEVRPWHGNGATWRYVACLH